MLKTQNDKIKNDNLNIEKLTSGFKTSYIINLILFFTSIIICAIFFNIDIGNMLINILTGTLCFALFLIFFVCSLCVMILSIILGVKNKKRITNELLKNKINTMIWILLILHFIVIIFFIILSLYFSYKDETGIFKSNKIPEYDFNNTWSCKKNVSNSYRTYTFKNNGSVEASLDSNPTDNYLVGEYSIEKENIKDSLYIKERGGKVREYKLKIEFTTFVEDGEYISADPVVWYVNVYNGNYMRLILPGSDLDCTMK